MKKIVSLTKVFVKEFYQNLPIFDKKKNKLNKKSIFFWLMVIVLLAITYLSYEIITFLIKAGQPEMFLNLHFFILAIVLLFQTILVCANIFFFSKDIEKVLPMPIKPVELLLAKFNTLLCMLYLSESILGIIPLTLYGFLNHVHPIFYLWEVIILAIIPVFIGVFVSTILLGIMRFAKFVRNKEVFQIIVTIALVLMVCIVEARVLIGLFAMKNDEQALQQFTSFNQKVEQIGSYFLIMNPSIVALSKPFSVEAILALIQLIAYSVMSGFVFITIGKITYLKDILRNLVSDAKRKKKIEIESNIKFHSKRKAYIAKEFKLLVREPIFLIQCVFPIGIILITGILIVGVLLPIIMEVIQDESIQSMIQQLTFNAEAVCDILIILQVLFSISNISLTAVSREGKDAPLMKQFPIGLYQQFWYKNIPQITLNFIVSIVVIGIIGYFIPSMPLGYLFLVWVIAMLLNLINSFLMLLVDLRRPNLNWDTAYSVVKRNDNKIFQYAYMIGNILFLMYLSKLFKDANILVTLIGEMFVFVMIFVIIERGIKKWQNKLYNKIV